MGYNGQNKKVTVAVIGAGPAGLAAAYQLVKAGINVEVFESSEAVGGLAKSLTLWNQKVDLGPHRFFSSDRRVNELWLEVVGNNYEMVERLTRILYKGNFYFYPLKPFNALRKLGMFEAIRCLLSYLKERFYPTTQDGSFESWVIHRFGKRLFEIFFKTYSEKLWGIPCKEIDADFAAQRIKKLSLYEAIKNAFLGGKRNIHKTLVEQFAYPIYGTGMVYERMASYINSNGGKINCNSPVKRVLIKNSKVSGIELDAGEIKNYDHVISSMPISLLISHLLEVPQKIKLAAESLRFRNTILVYLQIQSTEVFPDNWLYIHSPDLKVGRITNFRNWVTQLYGDEKSTILALEYWCYDEDKIWTSSDEELISLAIKEIRETGLVGNSQILEGYIYRIKRCYPVYSKGYKVRLIEVEEYLSSIKGLSVIGRYGAFKYNNQDHSILMGILAAENIIKGTNHNLWGINTDYEIYQEATVITKTGLQKK